MERPPGETRIPGLSVKFQSGREVQKEFTNVRTGFRTLS